MDTVDTRFDRVMTRYNNFVSVTGDKNIASQLTVAYNINELSILIAALLKKDKCNKQP